MTEVLKRLGHVRKGPGLRRGQPHCANARSVRNALDRIRLRHATRLFAHGSGLAREQLTTVLAEAILASRVSGKPEAGDPHGH